MSLQPKVQFFGHDFSGFDDERNSQMTFRKVKLHGPSAPGVTFRLVNEYQLK